MKTVVYFILSCFISTGAFMGALYAPAPILLYLIGFGVWVLFIRGYMKRSRRDAERREMEQSFRNFMRHQVRNKKTINR